MCSCGPTAARETPETPLRSTFHRRPETGPDFPEPPGTGDGSHPRGGVRDGKAQAGGRGRPRLPAGLPCRPSDACLSLGSQWPRGRGRRLGRGCDNMASFPPSLTWLCVPLPCFGGRRSAGGPTAGGPLAPSLQEAREAARQGPRVADAELPALLRDAHRHRAPRIPRRASHVLRPEATGPCWAGREPRFCRVPPRQRRRPEEQREGLCLTSGLAGAKRTARHCRRLPRGPPASAPVLSASQAGAFTPRIPTASHGSGPPGPAPVTSAGEGRRRRDRRWEAAPVPPVSGPTAATPRPAGGRSRARAYGRARRRRTAAPPLAEARTSGVRTWRRAGRGERAGAFPAASVAGDPGARGRGGGLRQGGRGAFPPGGPPDLHPAFPPGPCSLRSLACLTVP